MKWLIVSLIISFLLVSGINGCEQQMVCNSPYIQVGTECCLDENSDDICDEDESQGDDQAKLEAVAKKLGRAMEDNDFGDMYDLVTPYAQSFKTKEEFIKLYPLAWGEDAFISVILNKAEIDGNRGYVYYDITRGYGYKYTSPAYNFLKIDGEWYFGAFDVNYFGCFDNTGCFEEPENSSLTSSCKETCDRHSLLFSEERQTKQFVCEDYICMCICWNEKSVGTHIYPV